MKRQLIAYVQEYSLVCDNLKCDYKLPFSEEAEKKTFLFINYPCPKCGENLLTMDDYLRHEKLMRIIKWVNKWFSWLTIFSFGSKKEEGYNVTVGTHEKFSVDVEPNNNPKSQST